MFLAYVVCPPTRTKCSRNVTGTFCQCCNIATTWQEHCEKVLCYLGLQQLQ
uniref:Uncharacterized protein n=1 Tax=Anguilla anguilla TaxID=7936 RepID=A0A0E9U4J5_ANGAN